MDGETFLRVELDLALGSEPISGRMRADQGSECEFRGMLELIGLLDEARDAQEPEHPPSAADGSRRR